MGMRLTPHGLEVGLFLEDEGKPTPKPETAEQEQTTPVEEKTVKRGRKPTTKK